MNGECVIRVGKKFIWEETKVVALTERRKNEIHAKGMNDVPHYGIMEIEWAAKILSQLLIKEKCLKEKYVFDLLKNFGDVNQIVQHMNEKLGVLGFVVNNELINGEEYLILNCEKLKRPGNKSKNDNSLANIKEEHLFNSKFKKNEISLYYLIIDYIINNNENLKIDDGEITYESLCLKLNIKSTNAQESIRKI